MLVCAYLIAGAALAADDGPKTLNPADVQFFESKIRPVLVKHCYECHSANSKIVRGGLQLDHRDAIRKGGDSGPAVEPGSPDDSLLLSSLKHESFEMPPKGRLPDDVIADFAKWIENGAVDPRTETIHGKLKPVDWDAAAQHWAFQPISDNAPPEIDDAEADWVKNPIDQFVAKKLRLSGHTPAPRAEKRTLIRRATFDLTGLPPTVDEVQAFLADDSPDAFAKVVDRLLASPRYGERWGRHWLDLVRYANTNGADENHSLPHAWRFRDWVVQKVNDDLPLNDFIVQQLAGDLLPVPNDERAAGDLITATGMLVIGPKMLAEQDKDKMIIDIVDEQIDTVSRTMLGLTVACARCHDHKFDPISAEDYYALAGIFYSTQSMANRDFVSKWLERPRPSKEIEAQRLAYQPRIDEAKAELKRMKKARAKATEPISDADLKKQEEVIEKLTKEMPAFDMVMAVDEDKPTDLPVHIRGNHLTLSPDVVPRAMPTILTKTAAAPPIQNESSGRLQLARWLVSEENPLTTRVMANRIWMWHFGNALVRSPSNFGLQSEPPTHPELLDWLARELVRRNWSLKDMHRLIMLSATYQMSSEASPAAEVEDPENRLLRRQNRRRLEAEPIRDSILFVGGALDMTMGDIAANTNSNRRAIYLPINRSALYEMFSTFDYVETSNHIEQRPTTTIPQQSLFMMNSPIVIRQAENVAKDLLKHSSTDTANSDRQLIGMAFERIFSRPPKKEEQQRAQRFLADAEDNLSSVEDSEERRVQAWAALCRTLIATNEFIFVE